MVIQSITNDLFDDAHTYIFCIQDDRVEFQKRQNAFF